MTPNAPHPASKVHLPSHSGLGDICHPGITNRSTSSIYSNPSISCLDSRFSTLDPPTSPRKALPRLLCLFPEFTTALTHISHHIAERDKGAIRKDIQALHFLTKIVTASRSAGTWSAAPFPSRRVRMEAVGDVLMGRTRRLSRMTCTALGFGTGANGDGDRKAMVVME